MIPPKYDGTAIFSAPMLAEILGISWKTLANKRSAGLIKIPTIPGTAKPRFRREDIENYLQKETQQ